jgi:hypothetical protein
LKVLKIEFSHIFDRQAQGLDLIRRVLLHKVSLCAETWHTSNQIAIFIVRLEINLYFKKFSIDDTKI